MRFLRKPAPIGLILSTLREALVEAAGRREQAIPSESPLSLSSEKEHHLIEQLNRQNQHFRDMTERLLQAHQVLLFTDGISDAAGADQEPFGEERLLDIVRCRIGMPPEQLFDELLAEVHQFSLADDFEDDVCLVGMEFDHLCP